MRLTRRTLGRAAAEPAVFAALVALALVPLALLGHVVSIDGPSHVEGAEVLLHHGRPLFSHYYRIDLFPTPNVAGELLLAGALATWSPAHAEKIVVGGYVVTFLLAFRYAVRSIRRDAVLVSYLGFAFVYQRLLFYGFYNYCYGIALALLVIGFVLRRPLPWTWRTTTAAGALLLLTYFAHLLPMLVAGLLVVIVCVIDGVRHHREGGSGVMQRAARPLLSLIPVAALAVAALSRSGTGRMSLTWSSSPVSRAVGLVTLRTDLQVFGRAEVVAGVVLAIAVLVIVVFQVRLPHTSFAQVACAAATVVTAVWYLATPDSAGADYGYLPQRLAFFPVFFLLLVVAAADVRSRLVPAAVSVVAVVVAVTLAGVRVAPLRHYDKLISEVASVANHIRHGSTLLAVRLSLDAPAHSPWHRTTDPLRHAGSLVAALSDGVDLGHYEAQLPYFPTRFRPEFLFQQRTGRSFVAQERVPPQSTLFDRPQPPAYQPDYVLLIGAQRASPATLHTKVVKRLMSALRAHYRLVYVTRPTALVQVYRQVS